MKTHFSVFVILVFFMVWSSKANQAKTFESYTSQKSSGHVTKAGNRYFVKFNYDSFIVGNEKEKDFELRMQKELNEKKAGKGDKWLTNWNLDKKEVYERSFEDGIYSKLNKQDKLVDKQELANVIVEAIPLLMAGNYAAINFSPNAIKILIVVRDQAGNELDRSVSAPMPTYAGSFASFDSGVKIADAYFMAGAETTKRIKKRTEESNE